MANDLTQNPWIVDTPGVAVLYANPWSPSKIYWENPTTIGHILVVKDKDDNIILSLRAEVANGSQVFDFQQWPGSWFNGIKVTDLQSGKANIYLR